MIGYESKGSWEIPDRARDTNDFGLSDGPIPPKPLSVRESETFRSHMRKAARRWWEDWCERNLKWGDRIQITESHAIPFGSAGQLAEREDPWTEEFIYHYVDDSHVNVTRSETGTGLGIPSCYIIKIEVVPQAEVIESWDDEWL